MLRTSLSKIPENLPESLEKLITGYPVFDSSCSENAHVYLIESTPGLYLKSAPAGALRSEALMTRFYHNLHMGPQVISYESADRDYLLTARLPGEDCIHETYLADPIKLCDTLGRILRQLHSLPINDCPIAHPAPVLSSLNKAEVLSRFDPNWYSGDFSFPSAESAWDHLQALAPSLQPDVLIHGDFCLPNVILDTWQFSGLIDLGGAGYGNRHRDLFWGLWSLQYNLKSGRYSRRFLDAYGRDQIDNDLLRTAAAAEILSSP